ncbi:codeine O-demethylase-like [Neltuma alba]|uniref:codeine O-demethylase-like n=1 Tax=Neltuma alba TaxID=207710 RepID=UPI0010A55665|nr:codeine O-demethylase-like [Prosopis alba]XP_028764909.1 codeine O-demethylase-like [Prosopis alba]
MASSWPANLIVCDPSSLSVQELVKNPLPSLPQRYIREDHYQFSETEILTDAAPIPILDMNLLLSGEHTEAELQKLHSSCTDWGIFQVVNHGVSEEELEKLRTEIEEFFRLPLQEKMKYKIRPGDVEGYGTVIRSQDQKQDWCDRFYMTINPIHQRKPYLFPELPSSLRTILDLYIQKVQNLGMTVVGLLEKALKMEGREMREVFEDGMQSLRMTYYPPCPKPELVMGFGAHSDATVITILNQINGVSGLQVKKNGVWLPVNILPNALVVNAGDILEIMSNGVYRSAEHRATVNSNKERISLALFFLAKLDSEIGPAKSLMSPENPPLFKSIGMEKFVHDFFSRKQQGKSFLEHLRIKKEHATSTV